MASFKIGREFFAKAKADYADWRWSWVREICQNSMDCGSSRIDVTIERKGENTQITVSNDGHPMTQDILVNKFLTLGGSAKDGGVGGFGKAKEVLVACHLRWSIRTGTLLAEGEGGEYELTSDLAPLHGTTTTVLMEGDEVGRLVGMFERFAALAQWKGTLTVNGQMLATDLRKGSPRREYEWGKVYTNQQHSNLLVVRIGGQPMFTRNIKFKGCVLVELTGTSAQRLVASRDRLQYRYNDELDALLNELAVDTRSALKQQRAEYKRYQGEKVKAEGKQPKAQPGLDVAALVQTLSQPEASSQPQGSIRSVAVSRENRQVSIGPEFICKQCAGMETPAYYLPGDQFSVLREGAGQGMGHDPEAALRVARPGGSLLHRVHLRRGLQSGVRAVRRVWAGLLPVAGRDRQEPEIQLQVLQGSVLVGLDWAVRDHEPGGTRVRARSVRDWTAHGGLMRRS